jgi:hypothetical protein
MEDIRDELVYARSSGVESFFPDVGAAYQVWAITPKRCERRPMTSPSEGKLPGDSAGYRIPIGESEIKVVRCAGSNI